MIPLHKIFIASGFMFLATSVQAGIQKWVDEHGNVHYGDRVPAKYRNQERSTLNERGVVVKQYQRQKTEEELTEERKKQEEQARINKEKMIVERRKALRDRVLLDSYTQERDILIQRDARLDAVDSQITLTETIIKDQEKKLAEVKERIKSIQKSGRQVPENLHKEVVAVGRQLETHYQFVENKNNERQQIIEKFDADIARFNELMEEKRQRQQQR